MTTIDTDIETYIPRPGSLPWRVIKYLSEQPAGNQSISRRDLVKRFDVQSIGSVDTMLQLACSRLVLAKGRNSLNDVIWTLGHGPYKIEMSRPIEETPAAPMVATAPAPAPAPMASIPQRDTQRSPWTRTSQPMMRPPAPPAPAPAPATASTNEPFDAQFAEAFGQADELTKVQAPAQAPAVSPAVSPAPAPAPVAAPAPAAAPTALADAKSPPKPRRKVIRPAALPYQAQIRKGEPMVSHEQARYNKWLEQFEVGDSAEFRLAHLDAVRMAVEAFIATRQPNWRFLTERVSQYRAGIGRIK